MVLPKRTSELDELKQTLEQIKSQADTAKAQEEYLLKQLQDNFECKDTNEAIELKNTLIAEKEDVDKDIRQKTNAIIKRMQEEGFI